MTADKQPAVQSINTQSPADVTVTVSQPAVTPADNQPLTSTTTTTVVTSPPRVASKWTSLHKGLMGAIKSFWEFFDALFGGALVFGARYNIIQTAALVFTFWLTYDSYATAKNLALTLKASGSEITLIIAAITVPISALQAFVFRWYSENAQRDKDRHFDAMVNNNNNHDDSRLPIDGVDHIDHDCGDHK